MFNVKWFHQSAFFAENSILGVWLGFECTSDGSISSQILAQTEQRKQHAHCICSKL